jgi:hypothetical protein
LDVEGGDTHQKLHVAHPILVDHQWTKSEWNVGGLNRQKIIFETWLYRIIELYSLTLIENTVTISSGCYQDRTHLALVAIKFEFPSHCIS